MQRAQMQNSQGFTFVELIVVLALLGFIAMLTVGGIMRYGARQIFVSTVAEVTAQIEDAHARSVAMQHDSMYGVFITATSVTRFSGSVYDPLATDSVTVTVPTTVTLTPSLTNGTSTVVFSAVRGEASATGTLLMVDTRTGASTTLTFFANGLVQ